MRSTNRVRRFGKASMVLINIDDDSAELQMLAMLKLQYSSCISLEFAMIKCDILTGHNFTDADPLARHH